MCQGSDSNGKTSNEIIDLETDRPSQPSQVIKYGYDFANGEQEEDGEVNSNDMENVAGQMEIDDDESDDAQRVRLFPLLANCSLFILHSFSGIRMETAT
jgi:hypothetical protein